MAAGGARGAAAAGSVLLLANAATVGAKAIKEFADQAVEGGRRFAAYSPELSRARAEADIRRQLMDIREGQELGPSLAKLTESMSRLDKNLREITIPVRREWNNFLNAWAKTANLLLEARFSKSQREQLEKNDQARIQWLWFDFFRAEIPTYNRPPDALERAKSERLRVPAFLGK